MLNKINLKNAGSPDELWSQIREFGLDQVARIIWSMPDPNFPEASNLLPKMAAESTQRSWTGASGEVLRNQSIDFLRVVSERYCWFTGKSLRGAKILDYGCGYGRLLRLLPFFTEIKNIYGVDPWDRALELCAEDGVPGNLSLVPYLPDGPIPGPRFQFVFAFSVFTHTSERATKAGIQAILQSLAPGGICAITIRPRNYWTISSQAVSAGVVADLENQHDLHGFAFLPHQREAVDGDITYGDTSFTTEWLEKNIEGIELLGTDSSATDVHQNYVFFRGREN